jgi:cell division protein ZapD
VSEIETFEQPLNERFRLFLRAEQLFERIDHHLAGETRWDTHAALQSVLELLHTISRGDSKLELIKEIDRERAALAQRESPEAATRTRVEQTLDDQQRLLDALHDHHGALGAELRDNELLNNVQQRASAGGRPAILDLPAYQEWLQRPASQRHATIGEWLEPLTAARQGFERCLRLVRDSAEWRRVEVDDGFYEHMLNTSSAIQVLRVRMVRDTAEGSDHRFPEISAGRQRFSIRFFQQTTPAQRANQIRSALSFDMALCGLG